jgi:hypothetical protein
VADRPSLLAAVRVCAGAGSVVVLRVAGACLLGFDLHDGDEIGAHTYNEGGQQAAGFDCVCVMSFMPIGADVQIWWVVLLGCG